MSLEDIQLQIVIDVQGTAAGVSKQLDQMGRAIDGVTDKTSAMVGVNRNSIRSWSDLTDQLGAVETKYDAVFRAGVHMTQMGHDLLDISQKLIGAGKGFIAAYAPYDFILRRASTALNTNAQWQKKLDLAIQDTAKTLGTYKPDEVADAYYVWGAAAGVVVDSQKKLNDITSVTKDVLIATAMAGGSMETNLKGVFGIMSQFNLAADQGGHITQVLALMTERTAADFGDLINAFTYIGPLASSLGVHFEDVAQLLGVLADSGIRGSRAGRGLSMVLEGLSAPSAKAKDALNGVVERTHGIGTEFSKIVFPKGEFIGMTGFINEMAKGMKGLNDQQRGYVYATAFTNNATRALIPLVEKQIQLWDKETDSGKKLTSVLDDQKYALKGAGAFFETMKDQYLGSINAITGSLSNSFFPIIQLIATRIMELAKPIMNTVKGWADAFHTFLENNPALVDAVVHVGALAAVVSGLAGALFLFGGMLLLAFANLGVFTRGIGRVIGPFASLGVIVAGIVAIIVSNIGGLRDAFGNLFGAIGDLLGAILGDTKTFSDAMSAVWGVLSPTVEAAARVLASGINWLADRIRALTKNKEFIHWAQVVLSVILPLRGAATVLVAMSGAMWAAQRAASVLGPALKALSGLGTLASLAASLGPVGIAIAVVVAAVIGLYYAWQNNFLGIRDIVANVVGWLTGTAIPAVQGFITNIVSTISGVVNTIVSIAAQIAAPFVAVFEKAIPAAISKVGEWWGVLSDSFSFAWSLIQPVLATLWTTIQQVFFQNIVPALQHLWTVASEAFAGMVTAIGPLVDAIVNFLGPAWSLLVTVVSFVVGLIGGIVADFVVHVVGALAIVIGFIVDRLSPVINGLVRIFGDVFTGVINIVSIAFETVMNVIKAALEIITGIINVFTGILTLNWDTVWKGITQILGGVWDLMSSIVKGALEFISTVISTVMSVIKDIFQTVWDFIVHNIISPVIDWFKSFFGPAFEGIGRAFSSVWQAVSGVFTGIWNGMLQFIGSVVGTIIGVIKNVVGVAASIPGPWQDGAKSVQGALSKMEGAAKSWGKNTDTIMTNSYDKQLADAKKYGTDIAQVYADSIAGQSGYFVKQMNTFLGAGKALLKTASPPKKGPLHFIDKWGIGAARVYADSWASQGKYLARGVDSFLGSANLPGTDGLDSNLSVTSDATKVVRFELDFTSSDGSVSDRDIEQLKQAVTGSDMVRALQRMAEVD